MGKEDSKGFSWITFITIVFPIIIAIFMSYLSVTNNFNQRLRLIQVLIILHILLNGVLRMKVLRNSLIRKKYPSK